VTAKHVTCVNPSSVAGASVHPVGKTVRSALWFRSGCYGGPFAKARPC
jgi:hypothetical protein